MDITPAQARAFIAVAETGSFTAAAERVHRTQSAVSMQIHKIEKGLQRELFRRTRDGVALTLEGRALSPHARRIIQASESAIAQFQNDTIAGVARIGAPAEYVDARFINAIRQFHTDNPRVRVELSCHQTPTLTESLLHGQLDIALATEEYLPDEAHHRLHYEPISSQRLAWGASPLHDAHLRRPIPLAAEACRLYGAGGLPCPISLLAEVGLTGEVIYTGDNLPALGAIVESGLAIGVFAESAMPSSLRALGEAEGFPRLPMITIGLLRPLRGATPTADALAARLIAPPSSV